MHEPIITKMDTNKKSEFEKISEDDVKNLHNTIRLYPHEWAMPYIMPESTMSVYNTKLELFTNWKNLSLPNGIYGTLKQWNALGGKIKKGARAFKISAKFPERDGTSIKWKEYFELKEQQKNGIEVGKLSVTNLRKNEFHINEVEFTDMPKWLEEAQNELCKPAHFDTQPVEFLDKIIREFCESVGIEICERPAAILPPSCEWTPGPGKKYYRLNLPTHENYPDTNDYYLTAFHEMGHATTACGRTRLSKAFEEVAAESCALYFGEILGYDVKNSYAYINSWTKTGDLNDENVIRALKEGKKAISLIMENLSPTTREELEKIQKKSFKEFTPVEDLESFESFEVENVKVVFNAKLKGIELNFASKPEPEIRKGLKEIGYRWNKIKEIWYTSLNQRTYNATCKLFHYKPDTKPIQGIQGTLFDDPEPVNPVEPVNQVNPFPESTPVDAFALDSPKEVEKPEFKSVCINYERHKIIIVFHGKTNDEFKKKLKNLGFEWSRESRGWLGPLNKNTFEMVTLEN